MFGDSREILAAEKTSYLEELKSISDSERQRMLEGEWKIDPDQLRAAEPSKPGRRVSRFDEVHQAVAAAKVAAGQKTKNGMVL